MSVATASLALAALTPTTAGAASFPQNQQTNAGSPALWVDGAGRTYAAWIDEARTFDDRDRMEIVRVLPDGSADASFGRRSIALGEPDQNGTGGCQGPSFTTTGTLVVSCLSLTPDEETPPPEPDWSVIETYTSQGSKTSRRVVELPEYGDYKLLLGGTADGRIAELDSFGRLYLMGTSGGATVVSTGVADPGSSFTVDIAQVAGGPLHLLVADFERTGRVITIGGGTRTIDCGAGRRVDAVLPGPGADWGYTCAGEGDVVAHHVGASTWSRTVPACNGLGGGARSANGNLLVTCSSIAGGGSQVALVPQTGTVLRSTPVGADYGAQVAFVDSTRLAVGGHQVQTSTTGTMHVDVTTFSATVPAKPAPPTATPAPGQVSLSWSAPSDGGSPITGYRITPYRNGVAQSPIDVGVITSHVITGLTNGASYRFTVAARNAIGLGPPSDLSTAVVPAGLPGPPRNVVLTGSGRSATATWLAPTSDGGSPITGYLIRLYANGTFLQDVLLGSSLTTTLRDLRPGVTYAVEVAATNAIGRGPWSTTSNALVPPPITFNSWPELVDRQHRDLLGRPATAAERAMWSRLLSSAPLPVGVLPAWLRGGPDNTANVDPTIRLYAASFGRTPDLGGLRHWVDRKRAGVRLSAIASSFATSSEFARTYGTLSHRDFVELVYRNVLGRSGDPSGVAYWTRQLDQGRSTRGQVMVGFSESGEHVRRSHARVETIALTALLLDRTPTDGEVAASERSLEGGASVADLATVILTSDDYATRLGGPS